MSELQGLRSHKMELDSRLEELQCARRDLMEELDELMKLLKAGSFFVHPSPTECIINHQLEEGLKCCKLQHMVNHVIFVQLLFFNNLLKFAKLQQP